MSYFGHGTVKEDILDGLRAVEVEHSYTPAQMIALVIRVLQYYSDDIDMDEKEA